MLFGSKDKNIEKAIEKKNSKAVIGLFEDKDMSVRLKAMAAAGKIADDDSMNALIPLLHSSDKQIRSAAAAALGELGNAHASAFLSYQLDHEEDAAIREVLKKAMTQLHSEKG